MTPSSSVINAQRHQRAESFNAAGSEESFNARSQRSHSTPEGVMVPKTTCISSCHKTGRTVYKEAGKAVARIITRTTHSSLHQKNTRTHRLDLPPPANQPPNPPDVR